MMSDREISRTITHRFAAWQELLEENRGTPVLVLAVRQDPTGEDQMTLCCVPGDVEEHEVRRMLLESIQCLDAGRIAR